MTVSASQRLMEAELIEPGTLIWVEDAKETWSSAQVVRQDNTILYVVDTETGEHSEIDLGFSDAVHVQNPKDMSDMTALYHIHEPGILFNLRVRSALKNQRPYTFMGTILIAVNPLRRIEAPPMSNYMDRPLNPEDPHPYANAELAYHQMRFGGTGGSHANQSIVVSGESGAGKTETSKIILSYLAARSVGGVKGLDDKVVESSPILESFGNSKTLRNPNSSRFGKYLKLQFSADGKYSLAGGFIETYLLEKSRVLTQAKGERNFHIFYELISAVPPALVSEVQLTTPNDYTITNQSGVVELEGVDDASQFAEVAHAFNTIGMSEELQMDVWRILAAMLHLSSMKINAVDTSEGEAAEFADKSQTQLVAALLGVEVAILEKLLCERQVKTMGEVFTKKMDVKNASFARDAVCKALYESLFLWIVKQINLSLGKGADTLPFIGVLDIFGFENFELNEFEQLLINYTNESLQDTFNKQVFSNELRLYESEGIEVQVSSCPDNAECIDLLSAKPQGVIPSLDNVCRGIDPTDQRFIDGLHKTHSKNQYFPKTHLKDAREMFWINHYAGKVKYTVHGWVMRNNDNIPEGYVPVLKASTRTVCEQMCEGGAGGAVAAAGSGGGGGKAKARPTVAKGFMESMGALQKTLNGTTCNFIRCIKPNADMETGVFDNSYTVDQLQCLGILQTCEVLKVGMPTRVSYTEMQSVLGAQAERARELFKDEPETAMIAAILWAFEIPEDSFRLGKTRVFFRAGQISKLESILKDTSAEKGEWVLGRLKEALENRKQAKKIASQARSYVDEAGGELDAAMASVKAALGSSAGGGGANVEDEENPGPVPGSDFDALELSNQLKRANKTAVLVSQQTDQLLKACKEDKLGTYAENGMQRIETAGQKAKDSSIKLTAATELLQREITVVSSSDAGNIVRQLENSLRVCEKLLREADEVAIEVEEAAGKCQLGKCQELVSGAQAKCEEVRAAARKAQAGSEEAKAVAHKKAQALESAKSAAAQTAELSTLAQEELGAFKNVVSDVKNEEESKALAASAAEREAEEARTLREKMARQASMDARTARAAEEAALAAEQVDMDVAPSRAPSVRGLHMASKRSSSVQDVLKHQLQDQSKAQREENDAGLGEVSLAVIPKKRGSVVDRLGDDNSALPTAMGPMKITASRLADPALTEKIEGHLMKQSKFFSRWKPRYFVMEDGRLEYYDNKSQVRSKRKKTMELSSSSITSYTNTKNCFCVRSGEMVWFLLAKNEEIMNWWMTAVNAQIHQMYLKGYRVPGDNFMAEGLVGRFFYRLHDDIVPQWVRTFPEVDAPRTGDGLFPGEVIEVTQVLSRNNLIFLRMSEERGWALARDLDTNLSQVDEVFGDIEEDHNSYNYPASAAEAVPILFGPGLLTQQTGEALVPGEQAQAMERFVPQDASNIFFIKLADGRGWVPISERNGSTAIISVEDGGVV